MLNWLTKTPLLLSILALMSSQALGETDTKTYTYTGILGKEQRILAYFPEGHKPSDKSPCFIFFHGGGWSSGNLNAGKPLCEYLSQRGIVALTANYSMRPRSQKGQQDLNDPAAINAGPPLADGESRKRVCVIDGKSVVRWARQNADKLGIDPNKIIISGASAGAHISVLQMMDEQFNNPSDDASVSTDAQAFVLL